MDRNYDVIPFIPKYFILRRHRVAILLTSSKLQLCLLKKSLKTQNKLKSMETMYQYAINICSS